MRSSPSTLAAALVLLAVLVVLPLVLAARADASIYWTNSSYPAGTIGRANLDGTGVDQSFVTGVGSPDAVAADAGHVYWTNWPDALTNTIGRANLDGSGVDASFVTGVGNYLSGLAVDARHIYWTSPFENTIGRANLDGSGVDHHFITGAGDDLSGLAVDAGHIYWANYSGTTASAGERIPPEFAPPGSIGRANLDGSGVDASFITEADLRPGDVAVDARHVYWPGGSSIGRANLDGTGVDQSFINSFTSGGVGFSAAAVAVDAGHVYWANWAYGTIGRASLDGSDVDQNFVSGADTPEDVAVDVDVTSPKTKITKGAPKTTERSKVRFKFKSSEPSSTFECKLAKKRWKRCESPKTLTGVRRGTHKFQVRAIDAADNVDPTPAKDKFRVVR